ncbi:MAG: hypothetical protein NTU98_07940 [Bacteroidetes bacterium]|nr:hypothetical protein [Bacteroidota bacterium]
MKKPTNKKTSVIFSYMVYAHLKVVGQKQSHVSNFSSDDEFVDPNPIVARQRAFNHVHILNFKLLEASFNGVINLASFQKAQSQGFMNYSAFSFDITFLVSDKSGNILHEEPITNGEGEDTAIQGLEEEYDYYKNYGYDTGELMELDGGEVILLTDSQFIYE